MERFAPGHPGEYDVAMSVFVLEHVADPGELRRRLCARSSPTRAVLFGLTVHKYHYFGMSTWATTRLHVADRLLVRLKGRTWWTATTSPPSTG